MTEITLLYFDGCPSWKPTLENLKKLIDDEKIQANLRLIKIEDPDQAQREKFLGSPSIRVNGIDLWPEEREKYALSCRVYQTPDGLKDSPTMEMLKEKVLKVIH